MSVLIYKLYNANDCYIGSTKHSLHKRLSQHKSPHNRCCSKLIIEQGKLTKVNSQKKNGFMSMTTTHRIIRLK